MVTAGVTAIDRGIQGDFNVQIDDVMMRRSSDGGWMETDPIITSMNAAYAVEEMQSILQQTELKETMP
jgi:hypothetical protein